MNHFTKDMNISLEYSTDRLVAMVTRQGSNGSGT